MIRDLFGRTRAAQMLSTLTIVMAIAPIAGPLIGGQIVRVGSWHLIFWLLAGIGVLMFISLLLALMSDGTPWTMAWIIALFTLVSAGMVFRTTR